MAERNRDRGGRGGGGGKQSPSTICPYCGVRYLIQEGCKLKDDRESHGDGAPVRFRECMTCHGQAPHNGVCLHCEQNPAKGGKSPSCPACHDPLPASVTKCRCGWESGMWQCKDCHLWWQHDEVECPKCHKAAEKAHKRTRIFVTCGTCHRPYKAEQRWCDHCNVECPQCHKWYPKDQTKCPFCTKSIRYDLRVDPDSDEERQEHELFVQFLKTVGDKEPQGVAAVVQLRDAALPDRPEGYEIALTGTTIRTPFREEDRKIRVILMSCADGNVGTFTSEIVLDGKPTQLRRRRVRF